MLSYAIFHTFVYAYRPLVLLYTVLLYDIILFRILTATSLSLTVITVLALQVVTVQVAMPDIDDDENVYSLLTGYRN